MNKIYYLETEREIINIVNTLVVSGKTEGIFDLRSRLTNITSNYQKELSELYTQLANAQDSNERQSLHNAIESRYAIMNSELNEITKSFPETKNLAIVSNVSKVNEFIKININT